MLVRKEYILNKLLNQVLASEVLIFCQLSSVKPREFDKVKSILGSSGYAAEMVKNRIFNKCSGGKNVVGSVVVFYKADGLDTSSLAEVFRLLEGNGILPLFLFYKGLFFYPSEVSNFTKTYMFEALSKMLRLYIFSFFRILTVFQNVGLIKHGHSFSS